MADQSSREINTSKASRNKVIQMNLLFHHNEQNSTKVNRPVEDMTLMTLIQLIQFFIYRDVKH